MQAGIVCSGSGHFQIVTSHLSIRTVQQQRFDYYVKRLSYATGLLDDADPGGDPQLLINIHSARVVRSVEQYIGAIAPFAFGLGVGYDLKMRHAGRLACRIPSYSIRWLCHRAD